MFTVTVNVDISSFHLYCKSLFMVNVSLVTFHGGSQETKMHI